MQALSVAFNNHPRAAESIAVFIDDLFRRVIRRLSDDDIEQVLVRVMALFRLLDEKDSFEAFYRDYLSRRLLLRDVHDEHERNIIGRLKLECGTFFTTKIEGMFNDYLNSRITSECFHAARERKIDTSALGPHITFSVMNKVNFVDLFLLI